VGRFACCAGVRVLVAGVRRVSLVGRGDRLDAASVRPRTVCFLVANGPSLSVGEGRTWWSGWFRFACLPGQRARVQPFACRPIVVKSPALACPPGQPGGASRGLFSGGLAGGVVRALRFPPSLVKAVPRDGSSPPVPGPGAVFVGGGRESCRE
jgi:hypothetical protein